MQSDACIYTGILIAHARASLLPLESLLQTQDYMTGSLPSFSDYVVYGRYRMMKAAKCAYTSEVWLERDTNSIRRWIERLEARYEAGLKDLL